MNRERGLFLFVLLVMALMSPGLFDTENNARVRTARRALDLPTAGALDSVASLPSDARRSDPFREPKETETLPPLAFVSPPLPALEAMLPPAVPDVGPNQWPEALLVVPPLLPGALDELIEVEELSGVEKSESDPVVTDILPDLDAQDDWGRSFDQVRLDALTVLWGRIMNEDRWDLVAGQDALVFQEVDPRNGTDRFAPQEIPPDRYESFAFAATLRNEIELKIRSVGKSSGSILERLALMNWLLDQGSQDGIAFVRAEELAVATLSLAPDDIAVWLGYGQVLERTFRLDEAAALYGGMVGVESENLTALPAGLTKGRFARMAAPRVRLGGLWETLGLDLEAEMQYRVALALVDGDPAPTRALGGLLVRMGRPQEAVDLLRRGENQYSDRTSAIAGEHGCRLGRALLATGEYSTAQAAFSRVMRTTRDAAAASSAAAGEVAALYFSGKFGEAFETADLHLETYGTDWRLFLGRGLAAGALGNPAGEVVRDLRAAVASAGTAAAPAQAALAFWLDVQGQQGEARTVVDRALELDPWSSYARWLHARFAAQDGNAVSARESLRELVAESPACAVALGDLGWLLREENRRELADVAMRRSIREAPQWSGLALRRGLNLLELDRMEEARTVLEDTRGDKVDAARRNILAWASYLEGDLQGANGEFALLQDSLLGQEEDPQFVFAQEWQGRLSEHSKMVRWTDPFDGDSHRPAWDLAKDARLGVQPRVRNGVLRISGTHSKAGITRAFRTVPAMAFRSAEMVFQVGANNRAETGVMLSIETARRRSWSLQLLRTPDGAIRWLVRAGNKEEFGDTPVRVSAGQPITVSFSVNRDTSPPVLTVTVEGRVVYSEVEARLRTPSGDLYVGLYAATRNALPVDVFADKTTLIYSLP